MIPYLLVFAVSTLLLAITEFNRKSKYSKYTNRLLVIIALLLPILLAGMRKIGVGTDTRIYTNNLAQVALQAENFFDYLSKKVFIVYQYEPVIDREIGYNILVYFAAKFLGSEQGVLLATHAIIIIFVYKGLKYISSMYSKFSVSFGMLTFYLLYFGTSLNAMRQWLAMAILFYAFRFLLEKKNTKFFISVIGATLFHTSAIIMGVVLWIIYKYINENTFKVKIKFKIRFKNIKDNAFYKLLFLGVVGIISLSAIHIIGAVLSHLGGSFARYVDVYLTGQIDFSLNQIIRRLPILVILVLNWKRMRRKTNLTPFLYAMVIMELLTTQLISLFAQSGRIGYYFSMFNIILYPELIRVQAKKNKLFLSIILFAYIFGVFYYEYVYMGWNEIIPYFFYFQ